MSRRAAIGPWLVGGLLAAVAYGPALWNWSASGFGDWQWFHHSWEAARVALLRFGEFPLWDPYHCGGVSAWGQPQAQAYAPTWWITGLAFGTVAGHKLFVLLHHTIGFVGMYLFARRIGRLQIHAATLAAIAWAFSGYLSWRGSGGHSTFLAFHYMPWIVLCWRRAHHDLRYAAAVASLMALVLLEGGTYPFPFTFLLLCFDTVAYLTRAPRAIGRVLRTAAVAGTLTLLLGAIRLWPIYLTMSRFSRRTDLSEEDSQTLRDLLHSLTARELQPWRFDAHRWVWPEYASFVGWAVLVLALYGAALALARRRRLSWVLGAAAFAAFAMGNLGPTAPWSLLHELPVFDSLHVPSRMHVVMTFYLSLLAAFGLDQLTQLVRARVVSTSTSRLVAALGWSLVIAAGVEIVSNDLRIASRWNGGTIEAPREDAFHLVAGGNYLAEYAGYPTRHVGTASCYDPVPWAVSSRLWSGAVPQVRSEPAGLSLTAFERTANTFRAAFTLARPARVSINQNYDPDWQLSSGRAVDAGGLLAVDLPAGTHHLEGRYAPRDLPWSALAFAGGVAGAFLVARRRRAQSAERPLDPQ